LQKPASHELSEIEFIVLCASLLSGNTFGALAQTRAATNQKAASKQPGKAAASKLSTNKLRHRRVPARDGLDHLHAHAVDERKQNRQRVSGRGEDKRNWEMKYDYKAQVAVIESPEKKG
jgi:hypothetical protein